MMAAMEALPDGLPTALPDLRLRQLQPVDAATLIRLVQRNRMHLTRHGDYGDLVETDVDTLALQLGNRSGQITFGICLGEQIVGTVTLIRHQPGVFGLGYWISAEHGGRGYVSHACQALIDAAEAHLDAREIWAGITHGNHASIAVATKLGLELARTQPGHLSYLLRLGR